MNSLEAYLRQLRDIRCSGFTKVSIVLCSRSLSPHLLLPPQPHRPRSNYTDAERMVDPGAEEFFNILLSRPILTGTAATSNQRSCRPLRSAADLHERPGNLAYGMIVGRNPGNTLELA